MTDRELLEKAAIAAGYQPQGMEDGRLYLFGVQDGWNPLTDDGDALRLAVKLGLDFYEGDDDGRAAYVGYYERTGNTRPQRFKVERHDAHADAFTATRRAIVRAAAAMAGSETPNVRADRLMPAKETHEQR